MIVTDIVAANGDPQHPHRIQERFAMRDFWERSSSSFSSWTSCYEWNSNSKRQFCRTLQTHEKSIITSEITTGSLQRCFKRSMGRFAHRNTRIKKARPVPKIGLIHTWVWVDVRSSTESYISRQSQKPTAGQPYYNRSLYSIPNRSQARESRIYRNRKQIKTTSNWTHTGRMGHKNCIRAPKKRVASDSAPNSEKNCCNKARFVFFSPDKWLDSFPRRIRNRFCKWKPTAGTC